MMVPAWATQADEGAWSMVKAAVNKHLAEWVPKLPMFSDRQKAWDAFTKKVAKL